MLATISRGTGLLLLLAALAAPTLASGEQAAADGALHIQPPDIPVTTFYRSTTVHVDGRIPAGYDAAVVCAGEERPLALKKKGKVWGVLWMTVGEVTFEHVPAVYEVSTSRPLADLAPEPNLVDLGVGYQALRARNTAQAPAERPYFDQLLKLKEHEGLYDERPAAIELKAGGGQEQTLSADCTFPAKAPPGEYTVELFAFHDGHGELLGSTKLTVHRQGFTAFVVSLARQHGLLYGLLAVVIALVVGLLTGLAFGLGSKGGH